MTEQVNQESAANTETVEVKLPNVPTTLEEALAKLSELDGQLKQVDQDRMAAKRKLTKFEKEAEDKEAKALQEQGNFKELYEKAQAEIAAKEQKLRDRVVTSAVKSKLAEVGALDANIVLKLVDLSKVTLNDEGDADLTEFEVQLAELQKSAAMLFKSGSATPSMQRADGSSNNKTAYEMEINACTTIAQIDAVKRKYGKSN